MSAVKNINMNNDNRQTHRLGAHHSVAGGLHQALLTARRLRCRALQIFVKNQRRWDAPPIAPDDLQRWHELLPQLDLGPVVAHAAYLINLAATDPALRERSCTAFADELQRCNQLDIAYLVVHPGSATDGDRAAGCQRVADSLNRVLDNSPATTTQVLLETTAGQGNNLGNTPTELQDIIAHVHASQRVGVCVDTCHVFAAGWDLRQPDRYAELIAELGRTVGLERIRCWHLNDSKTPCGSRVDRHEHIGHGQIGSAGFANLLGDTRFVGLPMILETPKGEDPQGREWDAINLRRLRTLATRALSRA